MSRAEKLKPSLRGPLNIKGRPKEKWAVYWPADEPGKRRRYKRFEDEKEARRFLDKKEVELLNRGREAASVRDTIIEDAVWAQRELKPLGLSLRDAVGEAVEAQMELQGFGVTLQDVVAEYVARRRESDRSEKVAVLIPEFLATKEKAGRSARYLGDLRAKLARFAKEHGEKYLSDFSPPILNRWLEGLDVSPVTRNGYRRVLSVFFEWGRKQGFCGENPVRDTESATEKLAAPGIFSPNEIRLILEQAPPELLPVMALGAFAGLRTVEIERLDWEHVDFRREHIEINTETGKGARHRFVPINDTLKAWLEPIARPSGAVSPANFYRRLWKFHLELAEETEDRQLVDWKDNGLRHSFGSYALAREHDGAKVILWMGHTNPSTFYKHYRNRRTEEEAAEWFAVMPDTGKE